MKKDLIPPEIRLSHEAAIKEGLKGNIAIHDRAALIRIIDEQLLPEIERLSCEHDALLRGRIPTHRCKVCGALWILWAAQPDKYPAGHPLRDRAWSLFSLECGPCCDNVAMGDQIELIQLAAPIDRSLATKTAALPTEGRDTEIVSPVREEHFGR